MIAKKGLGAKYLKMTPAELRVEASDFDKEMIAAKARPLTPAERTWWEKVRRKPGRPRRARGVKVFSVSVEQGLLTRSDVLARSLGISRAVLIERRLKAVLAAEGQLNS
jgi:hypothetical protein